MPEVQLEGLTLHVADIERSVEFYRKIPGANLRMHIPGQFAIVQFGAARIGLLKDSKERFHVELETGDLDGMHAALIEAGFTPNGPPETRPWGMRDFLMKDPDGNLLEFGEPFRQ